MEEVQSAAAEADRRVSWKQAGLLVVLLVLGAGLRVHWNDVAQYSRADEQVYVNYSSWLGANGLRRYPGLCQAFLDHPDWWQYPNPLRWGYLALTSETCRVAGTCTPRVLAGLSTAAGVLSLALTFLLGRELLGTRVALAAVALAGTSPLQLAMGRRALQDEPFCAASLLFFWLLALYLRKTHERFSALSWVAAVAAATLAFAVKESFLLVIPAVVVALVVARAPRRPRLADLGICVVPPVLFGLGSAIAAGGFGRLLHLANVVRGFALRPPYALEYQAGPPHRVLFDLFVLSPVVCLLAVAGVTLVAYRLRGVDRWAALVAAVLVVTLLVFSFVASKNVRYVIMADPLLRVLAAWVLVGRPLVTVRWLFPVTAAVIVFSGAVELAIFHRVFVTGAVYDPVTENLLRALGAISH